MTITMAGHCCICKRRRRIRRNGMIRLHYDHEPIVNHGAGVNNGKGHICPGSGLLPLELLGRSEENSYFCNTGCTGCSDMITYGI